MRLKSLKIRFIQDKFINKINIISNIINIFIILLKTIIFMHTR